MLMNDSRNKFDIVNYLTGKNIISFVVFVIVLWLLWVFELITKSNIAPWVSAIVSALAIIISASISYSAYQTSQSSAKTARESYKLSTENYKLSNDNYNCGLIKDITSRINDEYKIMLDKMKEWMNRIDYGKEFVSFPDYNKFVNSVYVLAKRVDKNEKYRDIFYAYISNAVNKEINDWHVFGHVFRHIRYGGPSSLNISNELLDVTIKRLEKEKEIYESFFKRWTFIHQTFKDTSHHWIQFPRNMSRYNDFIRSIDSRINECRLAKNTNNQ